MNKRPEPSVKRSFPATQSVANLPAADGVWEHLRPLPGALEGLATEPGELSLVVADGRIAWIGACDALPDRTPACRVLTAAARC